MGLDITAYKNIELISVEPNIEDWEEKHDWTYVWPGYINSPDFPGSSNGLVAGGVYQFESRVQFRAGSYSGYNAWREWLSFLALGVSPRTIWNDPEEWQDKPFYRLIHFSDCEGIINTEHSKQLAKDFTEFQNVADASDASTWHKQKYSDWRKAFETASDNGYVCFH